MYHLPVVALTLRKSRPLEIPAVTGFALTDAETQHHCVGGLRSLQSVVDQRRVPRAKDAGACNNNRRYEGDDDDDNVDDGDDDNDG